MSSKFVLQQEDGTIANGNARGNGAVDLSSNRTSNSSVASGNNSAILGGYNNRASGSSSSVGGGDNNIASGSYSCIGGGTQNTVSNDFSTISGGFSNIASSSLSTISGGQSNTASTNTHATVVGGQSNTASGRWSIAGGDSNTASGQYGIALGYYSTASGLGSVGLGGGAISTGKYAFATNADTFAASDYSIASGLWCQTYLYGQTAHQNGRFGSQSDAQISFLVARKEATLSSAATTVLSLDGTGTTNLIIPGFTNRAWNVTVKWVAVITADGGAAGITVGDAIASTEQLLFKKVGGISSVVGIASTLSTNSDASMASCSMAYTAGASQELALTFTGPTFAAGGPVTCRVVAKVELTEVAW